MLSSSGFRDALGERDLRFDRESGQVRERLFLRPELAAYESALRRRVGRLASLEDPRLVPLETVEHDLVSNRVAVVSRHVSGLRLHEVLDSARAHELVPDLTVALYLTGELLTAVRTFQLLCGMPHGALTPERIIISPGGEVVLADYAYAEVIEAVRFAPARLWREFGIAAWLGEPVSAAADVRQSALIAIALMLGRPLTSDAPDALSALVAEVEDAATIRGGRLFAGPVITWLRSAIAAGHDGGFETVEDAAPACLSLLTDRERSMARPALIEFLAELDAPPVAASDEAGVPEPESWASVAGENAPSALLDGSESLELSSAPATEPGEDLPNFERSVYDAPGPEFLPVTQPEPAAFDERLEPPDPSLIGEPAGSLVPAPPGEPQASAEPELASAAEPPAAVEPAPAVEPPITDWPPPPSAPIEVSPDEGPRVVSPSPFASARGSAHSAPARASAPSPAGQPAEPPIATVIPASIAPAPLPVPVRPIEAPLSATPAVPAAAEPSIRLKSDTAIRLKDPSSRKRGGASLGLHLTDRSDAESGNEDLEEAAGWKIPWKLAAAALVILVAGAAATQMDWGTSTPVEASRPAEPPPAAPPPKPTTGSVEVVSTTPGSKVLVDGKLRGETPLTIADLKPGRHVIVVRAPNGNVRRTIRVVAGQTAKLDLAVYSGWLIVSAPIELQIFENGKSIGTAGEGPIVLSAGSHTIEVANQTLGYRSSHGVEVRPGEEERLELNPQGRVHLNAVPWAEVWLDGVKIGDTPIGNVAVPLGTREFVFRHPQFGERTVSMTIAGSEAAQVSVDFTK